MTGIKQLIIPLDQSFAIIIVEMQKRTGIMLVHLSRLRKQQHAEFFCPIRPISIRQSAPEPSIAEAESARIIYLFAQTVVSIRKTKDITLYMVETERHIVLVKIHFEQMELTILSRIDFRKDKIISVGLVELEEEEMITVLTETEKHGFKNRNLRYFIREGKKLSELKTNNKKNYLKTVNDLDRQIRFEDAPSLCNLNSVKFSTKVLCSEYEIEEEEPKQTQFNDFAGGVIMSVYNKVTSEQEWPQRQIISLKSKLKLANDPRNQQDMP